MNQGNQNVSGGGNGNGNGNGGELPPVPGGYVESLKSQENVVIYYFSALMKHCEALGNHEVLHQA